MSRHVSTTTTTPTTDVTSTTACVAGRDRRAAVTSSAPTSTCAAGRLSNRTVHRVTARHDRHNQPRHDRLTNHKNASLGSKFMHTIVRRSATAAAAGAGGGGEDAVFARSQNETAPRNDAKSCRPKSKYMYMYVTQPRRRDQKTLSGEKE